MNSVLNSKHFLKQQYSEVIYLASFYRWSAFRSNNATGSRSPIDGKPYTNINGRLHHKAYKAGEIAMSKTYFKIAEQLRKEITKA